MNRNIVAFLTFAALNGAGAVAFGSGRFGLSVVLVIASGVIPVGLLTWLERGAK